MKDAEERLARRQEEENDADDEETLGRIRRKQEYESKIRDMLTPEDRMRLQLKWGAEYTDAEWVHLEDIYSQYANEYEMSVDREQILRSICKTSMKMDQALSGDDIKGFKDLSGVFDMLRRSGKFTDAQRREEKARDIDSIGQLVQYVEQEGGIIPEYGDVVEEPEDKVDFMIRDMKMYTDNLVKKELGLGNLIESYIEREKKNHPKSAEELIDERPQPSKSDIGFKMFQQVMADKKDGGAEDGS